MNQYETYKNQYKLDYDSLNGKYNRISFIRLVLTIAFIATIYYSFKDYSPYFIVLGALLIVGFIILVKRHRKIAWHRSLKQKLIDINSEEITYLTEEGIPFYNGSAYIDTKHFYAYDLDFFGDSSLYHHLNRTATHIGSETLSQLLLSRLPNDEIINNQVGINELSGKIEWRQNLLALGKIAEDSKENYNRIITWSKSASSNIPKLVLLLSYITPALFIVAVITFFITDNWLYFYAAEGIFILNLLIGGTQLPKLKKEIIDADSIPIIINQYGLILESIEGQKFDSTRLNQLQSRIHLTADSSSAQIKKLSSLFANIQSIQNVMGAVIFNGVALYHIHALKRLLNWKKQYANAVSTWLETMGQLEALNSMANLSYNNPSFTYPDINEDLKVEFESLGHPLISSQKRVNNDLSFNQQQFVILTGSNMSGKSTFLRTLGINMVLAGVGAPICATKANVHPLDVIVSMRLSDSLADSESYFFAEVKRLKKIIDKLEEQKCFVLLDEILKGTNSDDKQTGTIEVIKRIVANKAIGVIATHDLEVCNTTTQFPDELINKCFEVEIVDNELVFDYKLNNGVCKNKSATFLLEKLEVI